VHEFVRALLGVKEVEAPDEEDASGGKPHPRIVLTVKNGKVIEEKFDDD
jgi:hypothetical protein